MSSDESLISVVITTYNRSDLLPRAIDSVLRQTYSEFELVVVDDGSTDDTREVVSSIGDGRLGYVFQQNSGLSAARNTGFASTSGRYIVFLDDDDEVDRRWLESFAEVMEQSNPAVVCCGAVYLDESGEPFRTIHPQKIGPDDDGQRGLFRTGAYAVRRDVFEAVGGYAVGARRSQNTELQMRLIPLCAQNGWRIESIDKPLLRAHRHKPGSGYYSGKLIGATYILEEHEEALSQNPLRFGNYAAIAGVSACRLGQFDEARGYFKKAIRIDPMKLRNYAHLLVAYCPPVASRIWKVRNRRHATMKLRP